MKKYLVDIYFTPYTIICGEILNDFPELLDTVMTQAVSAPKAANNVRYRFLRNRGTNGHPLSQFQFIPREA